MARPRIISDEQITAAAREVFLEHGFSATTAEIARRAGISEGTLFKRFPSKEDIFEEVVGLREAPQWREHLNAQVGCGDVRRNLERAALELLEAAARLLPNLMLMFSRGQANPMLMKLDNPMREDTQAVASYLRAEVALGRIRPVDADVTALLWMGALTQYLHLEHLMPDPHRPPMDSGRLVRGVMDVLWPGLEP
ncbi:TetR/AcrR family transcriptional regulator [Deinococcus sp. QL22]|uniref:TetR/AcrR family transcriptional regulator n=1 Tax=Deinococcus sp. QL22 TaxID=2939437 RepID=UPI002017DD6F|nr:TetR/AcrR family transcriptional regulator [Deinococcus sp. QL22]UQN07438.1 TetR/AcrR family transcriptional regulator [Deinococcus sp. QL22]